MRSVVDGSFAAALAMLMGFGMAQTPQQVVQPAPAPVSSSPRAFDHQRAEHQRQDCALCHTRADNAPSPRYAGHTACMSCHSADFTAPDSALCATCHRQPLTTDAALTDFPGRLRQYGLRGFSHADHKSTDKMKQAAPECSTCHRFDARGVRSSFPGHVECYACHAHQPGGEFAGCGSCHASQDKAMQITRARDTALRLYNFTHGTHLNTREVGGRCERCHALTKRVSATQPDIATLGTARGQRHRSACWSCHAQAREPVCTRCHVGSLPW